MEDTHEGETWAAHEIGHAFDGALHPNAVDHRDYGRGTIDISTSRLGYIGEDGELIPLAGGCSLSTYLTACYTRNLDGDGYLVEHNDRIDPQEDFADMFSGYVYGFESNGAGYVRQNWMRQHMQGWIILAVTNNGFTLPE